MEGDGAGAGYETEREGKLVLEARVAAVETGEEEFAEAFEVAGREDWFGFHEGDDGWKLGYFQVFSLISYLLWAKGRKLREEGGMW